MDYSACVLLVNIKSEKALPRTLKSTPQEFQSCEMWSLVTVNNKPWVDSIYPYPNLHKFFWWPKFAIERTTNMTFDTKCAFSDAFLLI